MIDIEALQAKYVLVKANLQKAPNCTSYRIHSGMYGVKCYEGKLWRVYQLVENDGKPWIAIDFDNDYGAYSDPYPTKRDTFIALGFE